MKRIYLTILSLIFSLNFLSAQQNPQRATPINTATINNLYKVNEGVYRSAQPGAAACKEFEDMGIKEIINLRHCCNDKKEASETDLILHHVKMLASNCKWKKVVEALCIIKDREGPVVIHCKHGADRTGLVVALYRIVFQGWDKEAAIDELENGGFDFHAIYSNIPAYIRKIDVLELKKAVLE